MFKKVLVPVDLGETGFSHQALTLALREVRENDAELHLITIVPGFTNALVASFFSEKDHQKAVKEVARKFKQYAETAVPEGIHPVLRVYEGSPADSIVDYIARNQERDEHSHNFGFNFPWWDRLLGTYRDQPLAGHRGMTIGLDEYQGNPRQGLVWMLTQPFHPRR